MEGMGKEEGIMIKAFSVDNLDITGVRLIKGFEAYDQRGRSVKNFSYPELAKNGIDFRPLEILTICSKKNVVRGLHFQKKYGQSKLISCISGSIFVAVVDIKPDSATFGKWCSVVLSNPSQSLYIPKEYAVGTMALEDAIFTCACGDNIFMPEYDGGIRWDDNDIGIVWPNKICQKSILSERDEKLPLFKEYMQEVQQFMNEEI